MRSQVVPFEEMLMRKDVLIPGRGEEAEFCIGLSGRVGRGEGEDRLWGNVPARFISAWC